MTGEDQDQDQADATLTGHAQRAVSPREQEPLHSRSIHASTIYGALKLFNRKRARPSKMCSPVPLVRQKNVSRDSTDRACDPAPKAPLIGRYIGSYLVWNRVNVVQYNG